MPRKNITTSTNPFSKAISLLQEKCETAPARLKPATKSGKEFEFDYDGGLTFKVFPLNSANENPRYFANIEHVRRLYSTGDGSNIYNKAYVEGLLAFLKAECGLPDKPLGQEQKDKLKNYVLIIDEINRGNISKNIRRINHIDRSIEKNRPRRRIASPTALFEGVFRRSVQCLPDRHDEHGRPLAGRIGYRLAPSVHL